MKSVALDERFRAIGKPSIGTVFIVSQRWKHAQVPSTLKAQNHRFYATADDPALQRTDSPVSCLCSEGLSVSRIVLQSERSQDDSSVGHDRRACRDGPTTNVSHPTRSARRWDPTAPRLRSLPRSAPAATTPFSRSGERAYERGDGFPIPASCLGGSIPFHFMRKASAWRLRADAGADLCGDSAFHALANGPGALVGVAMSIPPGTGGR